MESSYFIEKLAFHHLQFWLEMLFGSTCTMKVLA